MSKKRRRRNDSNVPKDGFRVAHGHLPHMSGAGRHDPRPRRRRERGQKRRASIRDSRED